MRTCLIGNFLEEVASDKATPGGGSVAALSGAMASDLEYMVCHQNINEAPSDKLEGLLASFGLLQEAFLNLANADEEALSEMRDAYDLDRGDDRRKLMLASTRLEVTRVAQRVAEKGNELLEHLCSLLPLGSKLIMGNVGVAVYLAQATVKSSILNARINLSYIQDASDVDAIEQELGELEKVFLELSSRAVSSLMARSNA